jgi:Fe-S cluster assembly protein SufD
MANPLSLSLYDELINSFEDIANDATKSEIVQKARETGLQNFKKQGFPTRRNEEWKYTNITPFLQEKYIVDGTVVTSIQKELIASARIPHLDCYQLILVNGQLQASEEISTVPSFVKIQTLTEAQKNETFASYFNKGTDVEAFPFSALNTALFTNGLFIEIDGNAISDKPLHIAHVFTTTNDNVFIQPRHLIVVRKNASINLIESIVSEESSSKIFINSLTEVFVEENAACDHYVLQIAKSGTRLVTATEVSQLRHSVYTNFTFSLPSADIIRNNLHLSLNDKETESHLFGLYLGAGKQLIDNHSLVNHKMPHCNSNEIYKGVLTENSVGVFNGKIFVQPDAQKTNAFQQNNNLLLSDKASVNSKPQLEIFADDVKCSHGSTVGQLSKEAMFYLQSRGIGEQKARALLVNAFLFDVTEKIKIPQLEEYVNHLITRHIPLEETITEDVEG